MSEVQQGADEVVLVVPAQPEMWAVVRMTASSIAARLDFSFEEIEDLRLAVTELCTSCAIGATADARCESRFTVSVHQFEMHCEVTPVGDPPPSRPQRLLSVQELSEQILRATVDSHSVDAVQDGVRTGYLCKDRRPVALS